MNFSTMVRDPGLGKANLVTLEDKRVITKQDCKIIVPCRFIERDLAYVGIDNYIVGIMAFVVGNRYCVSIHNAMFHIDPTSTSKIKINGDDHFEFFFAAGSTVFKTVSVVKNDILVYRIYDEVISKGYVPCYLNYEDMSHLFDTAREFAGAKIGENKEVTELIVSLTARDQKEKTTYYRSTIEALSDIVSRPPTFVAMRDVSYSATNTLNRVGGSYTSVGIVASLNNPSERVERIEGLLTA